MIHFNIEERLSQYKYLGKVGMMMGMMMRMMMAMGMLHSAMQSQDKAMAIKLQATK